PKSETAVMVITVIGTVATNNLAIVVILGLVTAMVMFAQRVSRYTKINRTITGDGDEAEAHYTVAGELCFDSSNDLYILFHYAEDPQHVVIDFSDSHLWDASTIAALDSVTLKYQHYGKAVDIRGLNVASRAMRARMTRRLDSEG